MSNLILLIILWSFLECAYKKIPIYEEFITGVKEGMHYLMILFPSLMLLMQKQHIIEYLLILPFHLY